MEEGTRRKGGKGLKCSRKRLISLGKKPRDAIFQYAEGAPTKVGYEDYSPLLRDILSRGLRESRMKAKA